MSLATKAQNPLKMVYDALWALVDVTGLTEAVKVGNRVKYDSGLKEKVQVTSSDFPEIQLVPSSGNYNLPDSSHTSMMIERFTWLLGSGTYNIADLLYLKWLLLASHDKWVDDISSLRWDDELFVTRVSIEDGTSGYQETKTTRQKIGGWSAILTVEVEMHFKRETLRREFVTDGSS